MMRVWQKGAGILLLLMMTTAAPAQKMPSSVRVATRIVSPFVMEEKGRLIGFSMELWESIATRLNVKSTYAIKGSIADLLSAVKSGQADAGISAVSITSERDKDLDFSQPMFNAGLQILTHAQANTASADPIRGLFALLFSPAMLVWLGIASLLVIVPAHLLWLLERHHEDGIIPTKAYFPGILHAIWWAAGTLATQADSMPRNALARVMAILWMFTEVVFVAYFTAQVTASLTVQQLQGNISGVEDLPGKRVATTTASTAARYLREVNSQVKEFSQIEDAYSALQKGEVDAVVFDAPVVLYYASHEGKGKVQIVGSVFRKEDYGIVFPPNSPYRKAVNNALLTLREDGTYEKLYNKWFSNE